MKRLIGTWLLIAAVMIGCTTSPTPPAVQPISSQPVVDSAPAAAAAPAATTNRPTLQVQTRAVQGAVIALPDVANAGLQLPVVSPDGRWIAYLQNEKPDMPPSPDALVSGRGLDGISLWVRRVESKQPGRMISQSGACWPTWSADGRQLVFIVYDAKRRCSLRIHNMADGTTRHVAVGLQHMMMPAASPSGLRVAVAAYGTVADQALLFTINLQSLQAEPGPMPSPAGPQLWPKWISDVLLAYVTHDSSGPQLSLWTLGEQQSIAVAPLAVPVSPFDAAHIFAGIAQPFSPDRQKYAYYDIAADQITIVDLATQQRMTIKKGARTGAWLGSEQFVTGAQDQLGLVSLAQSTDAGDPLQPLRVLPGTWAPLWGDAADNQVILVGRSNDPATFKLIRLVLVPDLEP